MARGRADDARWRWVLGAALVVAVVITTLAFVRMSADGAPTYMPPPVTTEPPAAPVLTLPAPGASVLFFGDSYTEGYGAEPETNGYAYLTAADFGWDVTVDAISGTGYLDPGEAGLTYAQRLADLPDISLELVVLQGGLNDQDMSPTRPQINAAANEVIAGLRAKYPAAQIVLLGPVAPRGEPSRELTIVDDALHRVAIDAGLPWVSPVEQRWDVSGHLIDDNTHPDSEGYRYLADQLGQALRVLAGG